MAAAHPFQPAELEIILRKVANDERFTPDERRAVELELALRKIAKGEALSHDERELIERRLEELPRELPRELLEAPLDDDSETPEEAVAVAEARASVARGDLIPSDELKRSLGL